MTLRGFSKALLVVALGFTVLGAGGFFLLQQSPYWAGITLFSESKRVENFRAMDQVFPYRAIAVQNAERHRRTIGHAKGDLHQRGSFLADQQKQTN